MAWVPLARDLDVKLAPRVDQWATRARIYRSAGALRVLDEKLRRALNRPDPAWPGWRRGAQKDDKVAALALLVGKELDLACRPHIPHGMKVPKKGWLVSPPFSASDVATAKAVADQVRRALRP